MLIWSSFWLALFLIFALYGFSGARLVRRVPFLRTGLVTIAAIYGLRGLAVAPQLIWFNEFAVTRGRDVAFSLFSILLAVFYATAAHQSRRRGANGRADG
jgi:hypothetical protein